MVAVNRSNVRASRLVAGALIAGLALSGCSAGQVSQTAWTTLCRPPSCQTFARSTPQNVKRSSDRAKSYGCGTASRPTRPG